MKSHLQSYPCPLQINSFWNYGFLLGITIILQIITGLLLSLHYTSDINSAYSSIFFFIREIYYGSLLNPGILQMKSFSNLIPAFITSIFLLEKYIMDGIYVIFILMEHHLYLFLYFYI